MKELLTNTAFLALVGTLFGGAGLEIIRRFLDRKQKQFDLDSARRKEMRDEAADLREQLNASKAEEQRLETEIERWQNQFYAEKEKYLAAITQVTILEERLRSFQEAARLNEESNRVYEKHVYPNGKPDNAEG